MSEGSDDRRTVRVRLIGGPTAIIEVGGLRLLTDPTFDAPGEYPTGPGRSLTKTAGPALSPDEVGHIDAILLSHDQHVDNLDRSGRAFLADVPLTLTTTSAAGRIGAPAVALPPWDHVDLPTPGGGMLRVTAVPAQHGPDGTEHLTGEVAGFMLSGADLPTIYVSGDNASLDVVRTIAQRPDPVDIAVLFIGGAQSALLGDAYLTLTSDDAAEATRILGVRQVVPVHIDGWGHFTQGADAVRDAFERAGLSDRLSLLDPGQGVTVPVT
jgi:L-ascorbate metabolism protein UlaG (beta-lactamase superfamily)